MERQRQSLAQALIDCRRKLIRGQILNLLLAAGVMAGGMWYLRETYLTPKTGKTEETEAAPTGLPAAFFQPPAQQNPIIPAHAHDHPPRYRTDYTILKAGRGFTVNGIPIIPPEQTYRYSPPQGRQHQFPLAAGERVKKGESIVTYADPAVTVKKNRLKTAEARLQAVQTDLDFALRVGKAGSPQELKGKQNALAVALAGVEEAKTDLEATSRVQSPLDGTISYPLNEDRIPTLEVTGDKVEIVTYLPLDVIREIQLSRKGDGYDYAVAIKGDKEWRGKIIYVGNRAEKNLFEARISVEMREGDVPLPTEHVVSLSFTPTP